MDEPMLYLHDRDRTFLWMLDAAVALLPAVLGALRFFGWPAGRVLLTCALSCILTEVALTYLGRASWKDGSALVTGLLLALLLPPDCPWWAGALGGAAAALSKALSGGLGRNPCNPAALSRTLLLLLPPLRPAPLRCAEGRFLMGYTGGALGEVSSLLLLLGAAYLLLRRRLSLGIVLPGFAAALLTGLCLPDCDALAIILWGGTCLTVFFLAADPVTSPMTPGLQGLYGAFCGAGGTLCAYGLWGMAGCGAALLLCNLVFRLLENAGVRFLPARTKKPKPYDTKTR